MPKKVQELKQISAAASSQRYRHCNVCDGTPKGEIGADAVWARALAQQPPFKPFKSQGEND